MSELNGILLINKQAGPTSYDIVDYIKKISGVKKVGHTGTLDPMATGLLVVCIGRAATKSIQFMDSNKEYETVMKLGITTDTLDKTGKVFNESAYDNITKADIEKILPSFRGKVSQIPPMFSALKNKGERLYKLARDGKVVKREPRQIQISTLEMTKFDLPYIHLKVACSQGTYIRSLCDDIGKALGTGAIMYELNRTKVGKFKSEDAVKLDDLDNKNISKYILPPG